MSSSSVLPERKLWGRAAKVFLAWTLFFWGATALFAFLFFFGALSFLLSTKLSLYGISIWLNGCVVVYFLGLRERSRLELYHDCLVVWLLSYMMTNVLWEVPWLLLSRYVFEDMETVDDVVDKTDYMRASFLHMYWWVLASFSSVDLRTVNHDATFFTIELYAFVNISATLYFFHLNKIRSPYRYLVVVMGCGEPVAATLVFSLTEVVAGFPNMSGGVADTLLALVWTQYQYVIYPLVFGYLASVLLKEDWRRLYGKESGAMSAEDDEHLSLVYS